MERALSAPGKLFLSGEYAVLWGGTARIAAVGPRAGAHVRRRGDREIHVLLEEGRLLGHATPLGMHVRGEVPAGFHFAARTIDLALRAHARESLGFELALAPGPTVEGRKLGLGGSARAVVLSAEAARFVLEERFDALKLALLAHALGQNLRGSGGDVAAIFAGGIVRYRRYALDPLVKAATTGQLLAALAGAPPVDLWRLPPAKVQLAYAFAGESASTPALISEIEQRLTGAARARFIDDSDSLGEALERALTSGDFAAVQEASAGLEALLAGLGPLETEGIRRILAIARTYGCAGKLSGAGGGDGCILFAPDEATRAALLDALSTRGIFAMPVEPQPGLRGETRPDPTLVGWMGG